MHKRKTAASPTLFDEERDTVNTTTTNDAPATSAPTVQPIEAGPQLSHTPTGPARHIATIKHQQAAVYLRDLTEYANGDQARFSRMAGKASPELWISNLHSICSNEHVLTFYPDLPSEVGAALATLRLDDL